MPYAHSKVDISPQILEASIKKILSFPLEKVTFIWHGGEPLLLGIDFYKSIISLQNEYGQSQNIRNNIQTNATNLDSKWIKFFKLNKFNVGISVDGPQRIHDSYRLFHSGKGSYSRVIKGIKLAQEHELQIGCLAVVTDQNIDNAEEMFEFFLINNIKNFDFLPCLDYGGNNDNNFSIEPKKYAEFLINFFDIWFQYDEPSIRIRFFDNILMGMLGGKQSLCKFAGSCESHFTINNNGDIFPCDKFLGAPKLKFGNVLHDNLQDIVESESYKVFVKKISNINSNCVSCKWLPTCKGGCAYYRYLSRQSFLDTSYFCEANKLIFSHIEACLENARA
jgi:uncharacterized protein